MVTSLSMNYEKIDVGKKLHIIVEGAQGWHRIYVVQ
jgi:hypothetical protein